MQPNPEQIGIWFAVAALALSMLTNMAMLFNSFRAQKRQVSLTENVATIPQLQRVEAELGGRISTVDGDVRALKESIVSNGETRRKNIEAKVESVRLELKEDIKTMQDDVTTLAREVSGVGKNCELTNQAVNGLDSKMSRMLERTAVNIVHQKGRVGF